MDAPGDMKRVPLEADEQQPPTYGVATQSGVRKVEAMRNPSVWGKKSTAILFVGLAMAAYIYSLDGSTTWLYQAQTTSDLGEHSILGAVSTVAAIILAVAKPISAKLADVLGRTEAWVCAIIFYAVGYIILAACQNVVTYGVGWWIRTCGYAAVQILVQIIIGDVTTLRYRTFASALASAPFFINGFVGSKIGGATLDESGWRWGYGMFAIMIPGAAVPIIGILLWSQIKARRLGVVHTANPYQETQLRHQETVKSPLVKRILTGCAEVDLIGLILFTAGWTCLLLPITLANSTTLPWNSYKIIVMLALSPVILAGLAFWEYKVARYPFIPFRFLRNKTVLAASLIGFFDFISFYLQFTFQYSFIGIVKDWSSTEQNYFGNTQSIALTFFGICAGLSLIFLRRYKWLLFGGLTLRLFAVGLMIHSKGANGSTAELVIVQILQGAGGGIAAVVAQTAAQASVAHQDLASVTAVVLLFAEIGGAIGTAIVTAIWRNVMPGQLDQNLAGLLPQAEIETLYNSIFLATSYAVGSPERTAIIAAFDYSMKIILIVSTVFSIVPPLLVLMMKDIRFADQQNAVEERAPDGESVHSGEEHGAIDSKYKH